MVIPGQETLGPEQLVLQDNISGNCLWLATKPLALKQMLAY